MGTENHNNADQNRQNANQTQEGEHNLDRQQNQQGGKTSGGQAGQTDADRDRQSGNLGLDDDDDTGNNSGQQR